MNSQITDNPVKKQVEYKKLTFPCLITFRVSTVFAHAPSCGVVINSDKTGYEIGHYSSAWTFINTETESWKLLPANKQILLSN